MLTVNNLLKKRYKTLNLEGEWRAAIGEPQLTGTWVIYGAPKNGKTSLALKLAKYLSDYGRVLYNSVEEGTSMSIQQAVERAEMDCANGRGLFPARPMFFDELMSYLKKPKSPEIVFIDSIQFMDLRMPQYRKLKLQFPNKLFIYVSHVSGTTPEGLIAQRIWRDANVTFRVELFKAFPVSRFGGGEPVIISKEKELQYWGKK